MANLVPKVSTAAAPSVGISWGSTVAVVLVGSFVLYLLATNRLGIYLGLFAPGAAKTTAPANQAGQLISIPGAGTTSGNQDVSAGTTGLLSPELTVPTSGNFTPSAGGVVSGSFSPG